MAADMPWLRKRSGHLFSKSRFIAAQLLAYFENGLWLDLARHANAMAAELAGMIEANGKTRLAWAPEANEVFAILPTMDFERCQKAGVRFYDWPAPEGSSVEIGGSETIVRMVTSFATQSDDIARFAETLGD
jgi:threonine aldolase